MMLVKLKLRKFFSRYGEVKKAQIEDGFVIITFSDNEGALQAHYITNHKKLLKINGNVIKITIIEEDQS